MTVKPRVRVSAGDATGASARPAMASTSGDAAYSAADRRSQALSGWSPSLLSADAAWLHDRDTAVARIRDLERNEGWASAGIDRQVDMLVGGTFRPNAKPDAMALGISEEAATDLGRRIQSAWRGFAEDPTFRCDAERQLPFVGLMGLIAREFVAGGEALGVIRWKPQTGWKYATAVHVIDPDRLSNPNGRMDDETITGGVERDADGAPIAYHIRRSHPGDVFLRGAKSWTWDRIERWDQVGTWQRPKVFHVYDKRRPGQTRGISKLVTALAKLRMLSRYSEAEVKTAAINATIVGAIYTQLGSEYAAEAIGNDIGGGTTDWGQFNKQRAQFYEESRRVMDDNRFVTLFPTDRLDLNTQPRQTAGYPAFQTAFLQAFAASLGVTYEQLSMDWSRTNYSSARAALNEVWRGVWRLRGILTWGAANLIYAAWLEEALDSGEVEVPAGAADFYDQPAGYLRADWIGPARGYIDPVKEAQAAVLRMQGQISTLEREAAEQGSDYETILAQIARENADRERLGLGGPGTDMTVQGPSDDERRPVEERERQV
ncbi:phage portal protein [Stappia sp. F7233]|uniref:Phage portal protein n=1 Tax=Stappia albiluteola TaxID=2758565 RepID=A0A839AM65_9HYPH|nr:phage portal protein [Stappia albiluteola]MBA5779519.1 phage portal protein [Stappia albiluteola]